MNRFTPLFSSIIDSSVWDEADHVRVVWITMMAKQDSDHIVRASAYNISRWARKTEVEVLDALRILSSPDTRRIEPQEFEGRRIEKVEDGWKILNGRQYELMMRKLAEQARKAKWARGHRAVLKSGKPLPGERAYCDSLDKGDEETARRILDNQPVTEE